VARLLAVLLAVSLAACSAPVHPAARPAPDPALSWLASPGGQAQVTLDDDVDVLAGALYVEQHVPSVANHLAFEAAASTVGEQARYIEARRLLPPHPAAYEAMLRDWITLAALLQPGPGYGTVAQDQAAWYRALAASNIPNACGC
jgi:hypothetical protein